MPMGYSSAGVVLACGVGVQGFKPGDRVASNGPHAEIVCVPKNLCARVPESVPLASRVKPGGRYENGASPKVNAPDPPITVRVCEYGVPGVPAGKFGFVRFNEVT